MEKKFYVSPSLETVRIAPANLVMNSGGDNTELSVHGDYEEIKTED